MTAIKTFKDVVDIAKELLDWQEKQVEQLKKLPDFDQHIIAKNYDLNDEESDDDTEDSNAVQESDDNSDGDDEKNDFNNFGKIHKKQMMKNLLIKMVILKMVKNKMIKKVKKSQHTKYKKEKGDFSKGKLLKAVTQDAFDNKHTELLDDTIKGFVYGELPKPNYKDSLITYQTFFKEFEKEKLQARKHYNVSAYDKWLQDKYKKFTRENKKTVSYLVKEFEMKKARHCL